MGNKDFLEKGNAGNLQDFAKIALNSQFLFDNRDKHIDADSNPYLCLYRVLGRSVESLDSQVLLYPLEEEFHLPAAFVQLCDSQCRKQKVVGQKDKSPVCFDIVVTDAPKRGRIQFKSLRPFENNCLVASQSG